MDAMKLAEVAYRAFEHRDEIAYLAGRLQPYIDMIEADAPDLLPRIGALFKAVLPPDGTPTKTYDVKWVQRALNILGAHLAIDGDYGESTKAAVRTFQEQHGLDVDGWVGLKTHAVLVSLAPQA